MLFHSKLIPYNLQMWSNKLFYPTLNTWINTIFPLWYGIIMPSSFISTHSWNGREKTGKATYSWTLMLRCSAMWTLHLVNHITKQEHDKYDRPACLWASTSHHKTPKARVKKLHTHLHWKEKWLLKSAQIFFFLSFFGFVSKRMAGGFALWKAWEKREVEHFDMLFVRRGIIY